MHYQVSEVVNLIVGVALAPVILQSVRGLRIKGARWFLVAYAMFFLSYASTVLEGFIWADGFNLLEHLGYALAGILFFVGVMHLRVSMLRDSEDAR